MAFDIFSMPQGPQIPVSLFGDAYTAGARVGQAVPSMTTAIIEGAQKGITFGQQVVENAQQQEIRQHQIDRMPVTDQIQDAQLKSAQLNQQVADLNLQTKIATQESDLTAAKIKSQNDLAEARQKRDDLTTADQIKTTLGSSNPNARKSILSTPTYRDYLNRHPDQAESVISQLQANKDINDDEAIQAFGIVDFYKAQELKIKTKAAEAKVNDALLKDFNDSVEKLSDPATKAALNGLDAPTIKDRNRVVVTPRGYTQYDPATMKVIPNATPGTVAEGETAYEMFVDGVRRPSSLSKDQAVSIQNVQDSLNRASAGKSAAQEFLERTGTPSPVATATPSATSAPVAPKVTTFQSLVDEATAAGVSEEKAKELLTQPYEAGKAASGGIRGLLSSILPAPIADNPIMAGTPLAAGTIAETSTNLANKTLQAFNAGGSDEKEAMRSWAKVNGVPLTYKGLQNYYGEKTRRVLSAASESAYDLGVQEPMQAELEATKSRVAKKATQEKADEVFKGKSPEEAAQLGREAAKAKQNISTTETITPNSAVDIDAKVNDVAAFYKMSPSQTENAKAVVTNVLTNPILSTKPAYVKAVAAVENAGKSYGVSETNVVGPMQVTGRAAADVNNKLVKQGLAPLDKNNPEQNALLGQMYLDDLINQFNGSYELAYAAYNAGAGAIKYAQKLAGGSTNWQQVKKHILPALAKFKKDYYPKSPESKLQEVYNYPEQVTRYEKMFS